MSTVSYESIDTQLTDINPRATETIAPSGASAEIGTPDWNATRGPVIELGESAVATGVSGTYVYNQIYFCRIPVLNQDIVLSNRSEVKLFLAMNPGVIEALNSLFIEATSNYPVSKITVEYVQDPGTDFRTLNVVPELPQDIDIDDAIEIGEELFEKVLLNRDQNVREQITLSTW